ncbi:MAG: S41 family peptidase [Planctomycetes bacterium]|nr:S41 family peptidase [Planctomycetota bacterium]
MLSAFVLASIHCVPNAPIRLLQQSTDELAPEKLEGLIGSLAKEVEQRYVFADIALELGAKLRERLYAGAYEGISIETLASRLTTDLHSVHPDKHLHVVPSPPRSETEPLDPPLELAAQERASLAEARRANFGFQKVEILDGNVGYLELRGFVPLAFGRDTAAAAMGFLANVDALIVDLRQNGGGEPSMIQFLSTYFFAEPTHLNSFEWRGREGLEEFWTLPEVPGKRLVEVPIFVLTSRSTFSAAEEFTYNLRNLERATIVGETTGGGAHPGETHEIAGLLTIFIPQGRAINPITKTNWEGVGVEPHVKVAAEKALETARREAARVLAERRSKTAVSR